MQLSEGKITIKLYETKAEEEMTIKKISIYLYFFTYHFVASLFIFIFNVVYVFNIFKHNMHS